MSNQTYIGIRPGAKIYLSAGAAEAVGYHGDVAIRMDGDVLRLSRPDIVHDLTGWIIRKLSLRGELSDRDVLRWIEERRPNQRRIPAEITSGGIVVDLGA